MKNENKLNYYNLLKGQIQICEAKKDENLRKQWEEDVDFAKKELNNQSLEDTYYEIFVDKFLVNLIEKITKNLSDKDELNQKHRILLEFYHSYINDNDVFRKNFSASVNASVPAISSSTFGYVSANSERVNSGFYGHDLMYRFDELFFRMYKRISVYSEVSVSTVEKSSSPMRHGFSNNVVSEVMSFECTLEELINMYYMEKQRQEYENYDASKEKIKQK